VNENEDIQELKKELARAKRLIEIMADHEGAEGWSRVHPMPDGSIMNMYEEIDHFLHAAERFMK
jgi:hypothetical protein